MVNLSTKLKKPEFESIFLLNHFLNYPKFELQKKKEEFYYQIELPLKKTCTWKKNIAAHSSVEYS